MYVYGLTAAGRGIAADGIGDSPVSTIEHGELAAIVSPAKAPVRARRRDLLRHSDVLQSAFAAGPVVPLRFGTVFESQEEVVDDLLTSRYEELVALLQHVEGLAELRLRASYDESSLLAEIVQEDARIAALRSSANANQVELGETVARAVVAKRQRGADEALRALLPESLDVHVDEPREEYEVIRASFLVERKRVGAFERAAGEFAQRQQGRMAVELIGPMPPHSFVSLDGDGRR